MSVQTTYVFDRARGRAGCLVDMGDSGSPSSISKTALGAQSFGLFTSSRTADAAESCRPPALTGDVTTSGLLLGVTMIDQSRRQATGYEVGDEVRILRRGRIWVTCEEAMAKGDTVFVRFAAGAGGSVLGAVRNDADTASCVAVANGTVTVAVPSSGAGVVGLDVNLP